MSPTLLADKIERQLKLHENLETDFRLVMTPDAGWAFVGLLRKTNEMIEEVRRLKAERLMLDKRIHNQRLALRQTWEIVEMRRKWLGSDTARRMYASLLKRYKALKAGVQ